MIRRLFCTAFVACALTCVSLAGAQAGGGGGGGAGGGAGGGGGGRGGRGGFDPAQMRERMMTGIKERIGATDDEWKVIQPKLEKVMTAQRDARFGGFGGFGRGGRGGDNNAAAEQPQSPVAKASADLRATLDNKDATAEDIVAKLKTLREAREKAHTDLLAAQKELKEVLSQRQEAALVLSGTLD